MKAMQLHSPAPVEEGPLRHAELDRPKPADDEVLVRVNVCGACHTDLHVAEGDIELPVLPIVPGHQVVGTVEEVGARVTDWKAGDRIGAAWLHRTCGTCRFCERDRENLCEKARFTGWHVNGGFAGFMTVPAAFAYRVPESLSDRSAAPLLCAGIVGYRALKRSRPAPGKRLALVGFGASAHIAIQIAIHRGCEVYVFTRSPNHRKLAEKLGAVWVGRAEEPPPHPLDSAVIYAPAGKLVPQILRRLDKGGTLSLAGISMTPIPGMDYERELYHERTVTSTANATREDGWELMRLAGELRIETTTECFPLAEANEVLRRIKHSEIEASAVLNVAD